MISSDRDILLDIKAEQAKQRQEFSEFKAVVLKRLDNIETDITIIKHGQAALQTSVYWILGTIAIFLAAIQLWPSKKDSDSSSRNQPIVVQMPPIYPYPYDPRKPDEKSA